MGGAIDLTELLANAPRDRWLALNEDETAIVGSGETIQEAVSEATKAGVIDPIICWSPRERVPAVLEV